MPQKPGDVIGENIVGTDYESRAYDGVVWKFRADKRLHPILTRVVTEVRSLCRIADANMNNSFNPRIFGRRQQQFGIVDGRIKSLTLPGNSDPIRVDKQVRPGKLLNDMLPFEAQWRRADALAARRCCAIRQGMHLPAPTKQFLRHCGAGVAERSSDHGLLHLTHQSAMR